MKYSQEEDYYICANGRKLEYAYSSIRKTSTGYKSESKVYESSDCNECELSNTCIKYKNKDNLKRLYVYSNFNKFRK